MAQIKLKVVLQRIKIGKLGVIYWLPRVLAILYIGFLSLFALDVIGEPRWFLAILIHLIPSFGLTSLTVIAHNNEKVGGCLFVVAGVMVAVLTHFELLIITVPTVVIGLFFLGRKTLSQY